MFDNNKECDTIYCEKDGLYDPRRHKVMSTRPAEPKLHFNIVKQPKFTKKDIPDAVAFLTFQSDL